MENTATSVSDAVQLYPLLVGKISFREGDFDIFNDNREASNPVTKWSARLIIPLENLLIGNSLELARSTNKFLPNLAGKLANGDKVAYTETKAHRDQERRAVITT